MRKAFWASATLSHDSLGSMAAGRDAIHDSLRSMAAGFHLPIALRTTLH
jgi:hypothetical protein